MSPARRRGRPRIALGSLNQRTATRDELVREGIRTWSGRGWAAVGVQEVLEAVGVPKGSFYHYFRSKEAFGLEVISCYERAMDQRLASTLETSGSAHERIAGFLLAGREAFERTQFRRGCVVGNLAQELGAGDGALRTALEHIWKRWEHSMVGCLRDGVSQGLWPETLDVHAAASFFWVGWQGALLRGKLARSTEAIDDFSRAFFAMLSAGAPTRRSLLVMFGLPGAGKSFVARRLTSRGFHMHEGDVDLPADMREAIVRAQPVTTEMRNRFIVTLMASVAALWMRHPRLVLAHTFLKQSHRLQFARRFPKARFVLVTAGDDVQAARLSHRIDQRLDAGYVRKMIAAFDPPVAPFTRIANTGDNDRLERELDSLVTLVDSLLHGDPGSKPHRGGRARSSKSKTS